MKHRILLPLLLATACSTAGAAETPTPVAGETQLKNNSQQTFGGQNAEAYFTHDAREQIYQSTREELP